ncbi:MAG: SpoIIE family protein phosphatase [Phycisphaerales bacterium]|nr:SpoIIE family protein phosphatase [Phycisphaerales bacterium]
MLTRLPIKVSAPLLVGVPVLLVGLGLLVRWNTQSREAVREIADQNIQQIHDMVSTKVTDLLSIPPRICQLNEDLVNARVLDPDDLSSWRSTFTDEFLAFDMLSAITWGSGDGRCVWISRYVDGSYYWAIKDDASVGTMIEWRVDDQGIMEKTPSNTFEFDLYSRPWFTAPRDAGVPAWSEPYVWVGGEDIKDKTLGISYGIPMYRDDRSLLGIVDADFSLNDLSGFLQSMSIGQTGVAMLATPDGRLVAVSSPTLIVNDDRTRVLASESGNRMISAASRFIGKGEPTLGSSKDILVDGELNYLQVSPIGAELGLDWTLATVIPEKDFVSNIDREFSRSSIASLIAVALAVLVGMLAARWLVDPLLKLVAAVRRIGQGDLETRVEFAHAPEYTKLAEEINEMTIGLQDRMRMRKSLSLAMEVQRNLLPAESPAFEGMDIVGHSTYCDETGGDYYDFLDVIDAEEDTVVVAVGDVMGHGVAAAMLMATARGILRSRCAVPGSLADFLSHLNSMLVPDTSGYRFMTMLLMTISGRTRELRWSSAGHGAPLVYDPASDSFLDLEGASIPLGLVDGTDYQEYRHPGLDPGSVVLAATDGIWETKRNDGELYGMDRLRAFIRSHASMSSSELSQAMRDELSLYRGEAIQDDDVTFVIVKMT